MEAREQDAAISHVFLARTNPRFLERPCYLPWIHFLVIRSNLIPHRHLWTSSEFLIPHYRLEDPSSDESLPFLDEEDMVLFGLPSDLNTGGISGANPFSGGDPFYIPAESPAGDAHKQKVMRQNPPGVRQQASSPLLSSPSLPRYLNLTQPTNLPRLGNRAGSFCAQTSTSAAPMATASIVVSPAKSERSEDSEVPTCGDDKEKVDTFRVVDFAVVYLSYNPNSVRIQKQIFTLQEFGLVYVPIIIEGKRPPQQDNLDKTMMLRLETLLDLAQKDIFHKRRNFFQQYGSKSIIGIAFSGPYWTFCICNHDDRELQWSKAISPESSSHAIILDTIFEAAENDPMNPGGHLRLQELFGLYQQTLAEPLLLITGTHLQCFSPS